MKPKMLIRLMKIEFRYQLKIIKKKKMLMAILLKNKSQIILLNSWIKIIYSNLKLIRHNKCHKPNLQCNKICNRLIRGASHLTNFNIKYIHNKILFIRISLKCILKIHIYLWIITKIKSQFHWFRLLLLCQISLCFNLYAISHKYMNLISTRMELSNCQIYCKSL